MILLFRWSWKHSISSYFLWDTQCVCMIYLNKIDAARLGVFEGIHRSRQAKRCIAEQFLGLRGLQALCRNLWVQWPGWATRSTIPAASSSSLQTGAFSLTRDRRLPTTVLFNFSNMNPPCANKSHHPGTTPIGRQGEEEEIKGGSKPTKTSIKYNIIKNKKVGAEQPRSTEAGSSLEILAATSIPDGWDGWPPTSTSGKLSKWSWGDGKKCVAGNWQFFSSGRSRWGAAAVDWRLGEFCRLLCVWQTDSLIDTLNWPVKHESR